MTKTELKHKTDAAFQAAHDALQAVYAALNNGQQKKLLKDETVAALFERYKVET